MKIFHNLNETISDWDDSICILHSIFARFFFVFFLLRVGGDFFTFCCSHMASMLSVDGADRT